MTSSLTATGTISKHIICLWGEGLHKLCSSKCVGCSITKSTLTLNMLSSNTSHAMQLSPQLSMIVALNHVFSILANTDSSSFAHIVISHGSHLIKSPAVNSHIFLSSHDCKGSSRALKWSTWWTIEQATSQPLAVSQMYLMALTTGNW